MRYHLVTVYTFDDPVEANLARNHLEVSGLQAFLANEEIVDMIWSWGNAIGWIKLQVTDQDADSARAVLNQPIDSDTWPDVDLDVTSIDADQSSQTDEPDDGDPDEPESTPTDRETRAERAFRVAILGLLFLPIQLYAFYLLLRVFISNDSLNERERRKAIIAAAINFSPMLYLCVQLRFMLSSR
jgi:hypothetical protein